MLSKTGEYALQAMVYLAQHEEDWPIPGPRIAKETGVPAKYLSAILAALVRSDVLQAARGKNGGFKMVRAPRSTRLREVLEPFETVLADRRPCPFGNKTCSDDDPCHGHHKWRSVRMAFDDFVTHTSVRDVATPELAVEPTQLRVVKKRARKNTKSARK